MKNCKVVAFDADDTLWVNEIFFREGEARLCDMLADFAPAEIIISELYKLEMETLQLYGYGIKSYILSMIETAISISDGRVGQNVIRDIIAIGKAQMERPVQLYDGVAQVLDELRGRYRLVLATKGDLLDQSRKITKSGLGDRFEHIEIMTDKRSSDYLSLVERLGCAPGEFVMVGNSLKSDIVPVLEIGGHAIHVPCETTWAHEEISHELSHPNFREAARITDVLCLL